MCRDNKINTSEMGIDLGKDIDELINSFNVFKIDYTNDFRNNLIECVNCNNIDIDNKYNYNNLCVCCNKVICLECYNTDDLNLDDIISNFKDNRNEWMCKECGYECQECNEYYNEYYFRSVLDRDGDIIMTCCLTCINEGEYVDFDGEIFGTECVIKVEEYEKFGELEVDSDDEDDEDDVYYIKCYKCKNKSCFEDGDNFRIDDKNVCGECVECLYDDM
tara:strand:- start:51 stop:707 length:657 start_codon:yes stop_codon:yes gene_type:complete